MEEENGIIIDASTVSSIIDTMIDYAYEKDDKEIEDVFELSGYVSAQDNLKVKIFKVGKLTFTGLIESGDD